MKRKREDGVSLILVLWISVILTVTVLSFASFIRLQLKITRNQTERLKAYYIAEAGINQAILELRKDNNKYDALNEKWSTNEEAYEGILFGEGEYNVQVIDEESKLNINLPLQEEEDKKTFKVMLFFLPEIKEDQVEVIINYRKERGIFKSIDEVSSLKGMNMKTFLGIKDLITVYSFDEKDKTKINLNQAVREELKTKLRITYKEADDIIKHRPYRHLTDLLEVDWMNKNRLIQLIDRVTVKGSKIAPGRININTAGEEVLGALGFDPGVVKLILQRREESPFNSLPDLMALPVIDLKRLKRLNLDLMATHSHTFTIDSMATLHNTIVRIRAVVRRDLPYQGRPPKISILYWKTL
ncbi:MAG: helix-hairpin-helix domain-containing protein [bacterium]